LNGVIFKYFIVVCPIRDNCIKKVKKMVVKIEALYKALLPKKVVTFNEIIQEASKIIQATPNRRYIHRKYVSKLVQNGKLQRIRKELYLVLAPLEEPETYVPDKLLIAAKIKKHYYLSHHTALEYYGCAYSLYNATYISVKPENRFDPFQYKQFTFKPIFTNNTTTAVETKYHQNTILRVSSRERTFIDCLDKIQYAGGWEECIKSLESLNNINTDKLLTLLTNTYKKDITIRRVGYTLEYLRGHSQFYEHISDTTLNKIVKLIKGSPQYLTRGQKGAINKKWKLYIPDNFNEKLRGI
jgi:predicted transcriptional regulator of viral defense system